MIGDFLVLLVYLAGFNKKAKKNEFGFRSSLLIPIFSVFFILPLFYLINMKLKIYNFSTISNLVLANLSLLIFVLAVCFIIVNNFSRTNNQLRIASQRLLETDKRKDEFLVNASQTLRAPLNPIIDISELIMEERIEGSEEKQEQNLSMIISICKRLSKLIEDILDLSRLKSNEINFNIKSIDIKAVIEAIAEVFQIVIRKKEISLVISLAEELPNVFADKNRIYHILYNLIWNTVDFNAKGSIFISASANENIVKIIIRGSQEAMPFYRDQEIYENFTRAVDTLSPDSEGMELWLSISKNMADLMGGSLEVEQFENGPGLQFVLYLPAHKNEASGGINTVKTEDSGEAYVRQDDMIKGHPLKELVRGGKYNILIVDDDSSNINILITLLEKEDCNLYSASNGFQALQNLNKIKPDLMIIDAMMPGLSGYDVCRRIRQEYSMIALPILITTTIKSGDYIKIGYEAGANDFILKPFEVTELKARVRTLLNQRRLMKESLANETAFLQSQIKPHFLYNALSNIIAVCCTDPDQAVQALSSLSVYLRSIFKNSSARQMITIDQELQIIEAYVEIEKLRLGEMLCYEVFVDEELLEQAILIPAFLIQPLVENAIRHGIFLKKAAGTVFLTIVREEGKLRITVEDDGVGMTEDQRNQASDGESNGVGLKNVKRRIDAQPGSTFKILSAPGRGTTCVITLDRDISII